MQPGCSRVSPSLLCPHGAMCPAWPPGSAPPSSGLQVSLSSGSCRQHLLSARIFLLVIFVNQTGDGQTCTSGSPSPPVLCHPPPLPLGFPPCYPRGPRPSVTLAACMGWALRGEGSPPTAPAVRWGRGLPALRPLQQ